MMNDKIIEKAKDLKDYFLNEIVYEIDDFDDDNFAISFEMTSRQAKIDKGYPVKVPSDEEFLEQAKEYKEPPALSFEEYLNGVEE